MYNYNDAKNPKRKGRGDPKIASPMKQIKNALEEQNKRTRAVAKRRSMRLPMIATTRPPMKLPSKASTVPPSEAVPLLPPSRDKETKQYSAEEVIEMIKEVSPAARSQIIHHLTQSWAQSSLTNASRAAIYRRWAKFLKKKPTTLRMKCEWPPSAEM
jgi:hypothetical protein